MRAVERQPFVKQRTSRHDEMCALVAANPSRIFPRFNGEATARVEHPCGRGYLDVWAVTDAPFEEQERCIAEIKTNDERWCAGDALRQLKWYKRNALDLCTQRRGDCYFQADFDRRDAIRLVLVVESEGAISSPALSLLLHEGVEVLPISYFEEAHP